MLFAKLVRTLSAALISSSLIGSLAAQEPLKKQPQAAGSTAEPQDQVGRDEVVRISTNLVQFDAVVRDGKGRAVTNLRPEDFRVSVNGKPREITHFAYVEVEAPPNAQPLSPVSPAAARRAAPPPAGLRPNQVGRTFALVLDDFCMLFESVYQGRKALRKFVDETMLPNDSAAIISTYAGTGTLQQFTTDKRQLHAAIERLHWRRCPREGQHPEGPPAAGLPGGGMAPRTSDEDALLRANTQAETDNYNQNLSSWSLFTTLTYVTRGLRALPGRKAIVVLSDGINVNDSGKQQQISRLVEQANRASAVIYTIHTRGLDPLFYTAADDPYKSGGPRPTTRPGVNNNPRFGFLFERRESFNLEQDGLKSIAERTGGLSIRNTNDFSGGMDRASEDQKGYYLIAYRPDASTFDPQKGSQQFNSLKVTVKGHGNLSVRTRNGFLGVVDKRSTPAQPTRAEQLTAALQSPVGTDGIKLRLTSLFANEPDSGSTMRSLLHLDARDLSFTQEGDGSWAATIDLVAATLGIDGSMANQVTKNQTIRVRDDKYQQFLQDGLIYTMDLTLIKPGPYELRIAIRDSVSGKLGSARQFVEIPDLEKRYLALSGVVVSGREPNRDTSIATPNSDPGLSAANGPAVRRFRRGMTLDYGFVIYNAAIDPAAGSPHLSVEMHLYRDGRAIFNGKPQAVTLQQQRDLQRIATGGSVKLDDKLPSGWYSLEVVVVDALAKKSRNTSTQWVDFEIVD